MFVIVCYHYQLINFQYDLWRYFNLSFRTGILPIAVRLMGSNRVLFRVRIVNRIQSYRMSIYRVV